MLLFVIYLTSLGAYLTTPALLPAPPYLPPCLLPFLPCDTSLVFNRIYRATVPRHFSFPGPPLPAEIHIPSGRFLGSDRDFMAVILQLPPAYLDFIFLLGGNPIRDLAVAQSK